MNEIDVRQAGVSPKLIADLLASILTFVVTYFAIDLDPVIAAAIAKGIGTLASYIAGPGKVVAVDG